jgi:hypothetical protein
MGGAGSAGRAFGLRGGGSLLPGRIPEGRLPSRCFAGPGRDSIRQAGERQEGELPTRRCTQQPPALAVAIITGSSAV